MKTTLLAIVAISLAAALPAAMTVSTMTPSGGLIRGGELVHIHGTGLAGAPLACPAITCSTYVKFGAAFATIADNTAAEIVAVAPPHAAGAVDVQINVPPNAPLTLPNAYVYQEPQASDQVRFLVPVAISAAGALNTNWQTEILLHNANAATLTIKDPAPQTPTSGFDTSVPPFSTMPLTCLFPPAGNPAVFIGVPKF